MARQTLTRPIAAEDGQPVSAGGDSDRSRLGTAAPGLLSAGLDELLAASYAQVPPESDYEATRRRRAIGRMLRWLSQFPGGTWQARWVASGLDAGGTSFPDETVHDRRGLLFKGARALICLGVIQPDYPWLLDTSFSELFASYRQATDPGGFEKLEQDLRGLLVSDRVANDAVMTATRICIRAGRKSPALITADDLADIDAVFYGARNRPRRPRA